MENSAEGDRGIRGRAAAWRDDANLTGAKLTGAKLATVKNLNQQQLDSAQGDDHTELPAGLQRLAHWSVAD